MTRTELDKLTPLMLKTRSIFAISIYAVSFAAIAQSADPCKSQNSTMEMNACAKNEYDAKDRLLNQAYREVIKNIATENSADVTGESPRNLLISSQKKWIEFRDADCLAMQKIFQNGSIRNVVYLSCLKARTEQRIKELQPSAWQGG